MSTRSDWGEGSSSTKKELNENDTISMSLERKLIWYKIRTISEPIYEDELVKNMTMKIHYETTNTNLNNIYIPIKVCLEGYNKYELCAHIDSGYSVCFGKRILFPEFMWKKAKNPLQVR